MDRDTTPRKGVEAISGLYSVAQLGARMHYAVPQILHRAGLLDVFFTDFYAGEQSLLVRFVRAVRWRRAEAQLARYWTGLPAERVQSSVAAGLVTKLRLRLSRSAMATVRANIFAAQRLARRAIRHHSRKSPHAIYAFDTAALELFQWAKARGCRLVLEQCVAPRRTQERVLGDLNGRFERPADDERIEAWRHLAGREEAEWDLADCIICPSAFVFEEVHTSGVPRSKLCTVPYGVEPPPEARVADAVGRRSYHDQRLRVLFAGNVGVRKGILDLYEAAAKLGAGSYEFVAAGPVSLSEELRRCVAPTISILGQCTRAALNEEFARADCFVLPTYLEGSATVVYEALSWGLPIITTTAAGSVVEDGESGFVGKAGNIDFLVRSLKRLREDSRLRRKMGEGALKRAREFTLEKYGKRLVAALEGLGHE